MTRDLLLDLLAVTNHELSPEKSWQPQHAPAVDVDAVVEFRRAVVAMLEGSEAA